MSTGLIGREWTSFGGIGGIFVLILSGGGLLKRMRGNRGSGGKIVCLN